MHSFWTNFVFVLVSVFTLIHSIDQEVVIWKLIITDASLENNNELINNWNYDPEIQLVSNSLCPQSISNSFCLKISDNEYIERITNCSLYFDIRMEYNLKAYNFDDNENENECISYFGIDTRNDNSYCDNCTILIENTESQFNYYANDIYLPSIADFASHLVIYFEADSDVTCYLNDIALYGKIKDTNNNDIDVESNEDINNDENKTDDKTLGIGWIIIIVLLSSGGLIIFIILILRCSSNESSNGIGGRGACYC